MAKTGSGIPIGEFGGFTDDTVRFFLDIRFHNSVSWMHEHVEEYHAAVTEPFYAMISAMAPAMLSVDPRMEIRPHRCLSRINRDVRFSKDKSPYRDHMWFTFRRAGEKRDGSVAYWFGLSAQSVEWGLGFWGENRPAMDLLRAQIAAQPQRIADVIGSCDLPERHLALSGSRFKRIDIPENVPPALHDWYAGREIWVQKMMTEMKWVYSPDILKRVQADFLAMAPLYRLFRGVIDDTQE